MMIFYVGLEIESRVWLAELSWQQSIFITYKPCVGDGNLNQL